MPEKCPGDDQRAIKNKLPFKIYLEEQREIEIIYMKRTLCEKVHYSGSRENFGNDAIKFQRLAFRCCFFPFSFLEKPSFPRVHSKYKLGEKHLGCEFTSF